ncbi:MAG: biopolymer transporter ExbD [Jaaginema sp. PMC 1079.18]|nr:biopolymer transporter ExbD [Jaaginema sp. PMC 1080.18]MEC4851634.1 biopolymer transporter ExbD [Jaaginema sp. PMC 1079.18]MEC4866731.1 biopolymer transporter ExbD [Jaaginema sp. PMC 1078.18]
MRLPEENETPLNINLVSMIDVIFAILAVFIVASLFLTRSQGLEVNLPQATTVATQENLDLTVTITADGEISLNRQPVILDDLAVAIQQEIKNPSQINLVTINADEAVSHGRVVAVMDRLRQVDNIKLAIAAQKEAISD